MLITTRRNWIGETTTTTHWMHEMNTTNKTIFYLITNDEKSLLSFQQHDKYNIQIRKYHRDPLTIDRPWREDEEFLHERYANGYWSIDTARDKYKEYARAGWDVSVPPSEMAKWPGTYLTRENEQ